MKRLRVVGVGLLVVAWLWAGPVGSAETTYKIVGWDQYGTPAHHEGLVDHWDHYADVKIVAPSWVASDPWGSPYKCQADLPGDNDTCKGLQVDADNSSIRVFIDDERIYTGQFLTQMRCELWFHPDRIHWEYGPGSVGVRIDYGINQWHGFTVRGKLEDVNPPGGAESYVSPDAAEPDVGEDNTPVYIGWDGNPLKWDEDPLEPCPPGASPYPLIELQSVPHEDFGDNFTGDYPVTVYTCSY